MDSYTFANMMNEAARNQGVNPDYTDEVLQKMLDYQAGRLRENNGLDPVADGSKYEDRWTKGYANTDSWDAMFKDQVFSQEHNLSLQGGNKKLTYYASLNLLDLGGMLNFGKEAMTRYNINAKISAQITNWLRFNYSQRFTRRDETRPTYFTDSYFNDLGRSNWPNMPIYDRNGNINHDNPRRLVEGGDRKVQRDRNYYQGAFIIEPIKNWITNVEFNYSINEISTKALNLEWYNYDPAGNKIVTGQQNTDLKESDQKENYWNLNVYSTYSRTFADKHNFKIMGGFQAEEWDYHYFDVTKYGVISGDYPEFNLTTGMSASGEEKATVVTGDSKDWATAGFYGRLNYDYDGRYLLEVNMRYDGSSRFRRESRWQISPSFSLGWNIAQEKFFESLSNTVNHLKLRFSYGKLGNQNTTDYYPTYRKMTYSPGAGSWLQEGVKPNTAQVGSLISTELTWESVSSYNFGLDYGLFNNRLTGAFDYFTRYTKDMVGPAPQLPITLGLNPPKVNNCDLQTRGWEVSVSWKDRLKNGLGYGISASLSDQVTYIDSYPGNKSGSIDSYMAGKKDGLIWGYETIGIARSDEEMRAHLEQLDRNYERHHGVAPSTPLQGQSQLGSQWAAGDIMYKDINGDGIVGGGSRTWDDHGDLKILGDSYFHYFYGIDLTADWKGFDFRCFLQGVLKKDFWPGGSNYFWGVRGGYSKWHTLGLEQHNDYFRANPIGLDGHEIPANLDSYYPRPIFSSNSDGNTYGAKNQKTQTRYMQDAGYMRLKNLQIGYSLPSTWMHKIGISKCRVYVSGENLLTFTSLSDIFDPETATGVAGGNTYPLSRTWSFGLSVTL